MRPLRILHVDTERTWRGGERQLLLLARGQREGGHVPFVAAPPGSVCLERAEALELPTVPISMRGEWDLRAAAKLRQQLITCRIDLLHVHTSHAHALGLWASLGLKVPLVVHRRVDFPLSQHPLSSLKYGRRVHRYIAVSRAVAEVLARGGVDRARISVVLSAVPPLEDHGADAEQLRESLGLREGERVIGTIAHLADHKGHRFLIDALPQVLAVHPGVRGLLVGDGELREGLERRVAELGLREQVIFTGFRHDALELLRIIDVFVMPSHLEGLGTSILDALWLEKPVVATTAGGIPEIVGEEGGWLVPPKDPVALAEAVLEVLERPAEAVRRARIGRARVASRFAVDRMVQETDDAYQLAIEAAEGWSRC